uniref:Ig-like domain-containing protein n=1 Tax=Oryzias latipes TaxID=8090 RepID=A0A3B3HNC3_ORYLA
LVIHLFLCIAQTDNVQQPGGDVTAAEGDTVTLGCHFNSSSSNYYLFWYKQDGSNRPTFILSRFKIGTGTTSEEFKERFSSSLDSESRSVPLKIQKLHVSDSAVYYCALQPTVTGNSKALHKNLLMFLLCHIFHYHFTVGICNYGGF